MSESKSYAETVNGWEEQLTAVAQNIADMPQSEIPRGKLRGVLNEIREVSVEQAALTAAKQEASKRLAELLASGRKISTLLRTLVREHYGNRSEKLVEFDLQPLRGRPRNPETPPPTTE